MTFFSWNPRWGVEGLRFHGTEDEARERAERELVHYDLPPGPQVGPPPTKAQLKLAASRKRDHCLGICYGRVLGKVEEEEDGELYLASP